MLCTYLMASTAIKTTTVLDTLANWPLTVLASHLVHTQFTKPG